MKKFNTTGLCLPDRHYMADTSDKIRSIIKLVDEGDYFVINRARQYGKTTTLYLLASALKSKYTVFSISFEGLGDAAYENEYAFCKSLFRLLERTIKYKETDGITPQMVNQISTLSKTDCTDFLTLTDILMNLCQSSLKPVVLFIDEVDQASKFKVFLDFLGVLRNLYLQRSSMPAFQSVVLAGVYDIKNLKMKIRLDEEHQYNSPWNMREDNEPGESLLASGDCPWDYRELAPYNIAADFRVDISLNINEISLMLGGYEEENHTGMDINSISKLLYDYTSGYPYMVSRICKLLDEELTGTTDFPEKKSVWTKAGVLEAVKILLKEQNTLFDDMQKKLADYPELKSMLYKILFSGNRYSYETNNYIIDIGTMFGFLNEQNNAVVIANRIFETKLYNIFISEEETSSEIYKVGISERNQFIVKGQLSMDLVMEKFLQHFTEIYADSDDKFIEEHGRRIFLIYLKPIINGAGNYYVEARTRDMRRTDIIVDYHGKQEIIELKIWHGEEYNRRGKQQLFEYLNYYDKDRGYLLSFNFNKSKVPGIQKIEYKGKEITEVVC